MRGKLTRQDVQDALDNLKRHTLSGIQIGFDRLIYLASTRDYSTGRYYHDGLAFQFSQEAAEQALEEAHSEVFCDIALLPLEDLVSQLHQYLLSVAVEPRITIRAWEKLEPFRVTIPVDSDPLMARLFVENVKLALAIVNSRLRGARSSQRFA